MQSTRFAHSEGHTDFCYDDTGSVFLTSGSDGDLRIWNCFDDDDAASHGIGRKVHAIAFKNGRFFTASDTNTVQAHLYPSGALDGIVTRFTAPATHICLNDSGSHLLAAGSDFLVKLVEVDTFTQTTFQGHEAPVLSVALDPKMEYVVSSSCDGTLKVWKISDSSCTETLSNVIPKCNDISLSKVLCRMAWSPKTGQMLVFPDGKDVKVLERDSWKHLYSLNQDISKEVISIATFSPCGKYVAASTLDGAVIVWDIQSRKVVHSFKHERSLTICALAWNPKNNGEIGYADNQGNMGIANNCITVSQSVEVDNQASNQFGDLFDDDDGAGWGDAVNLPVANGDSDDDDDLPAPTQRKAQRLMEDENSMDTDSIAPSTGDVPDDMGEDTPAPAKTVYVQQAPKTTPLQPPFQPGSSPVHLTSRFMVWNSVGIIKQYNTDEENSIDIEFHDTATHHAMHVMNTANHTMADMSTEAVILACESDSEDDSASLLVCMHFNSWDNAKEWSIGMPDGENIQCITIGDGWIAVATDKRNIRMFSISGVQLGLFSVPGPVVTMAAHSNQLIVTYHGGAGIPGDQRLAYHLYQISGRKRRVLADELPLSRKSTLSWLGFSAEGTPFAVDSAGIVRLLNRQFSPTWVQVANTKSHAKGKSDNYWIVGMYENPQQLRCVLCKGSTYPPTLPRPAVIILPFQLPLCELSTEKGQLEESLWRSKSFSGHIHFWRSQGLMADDVDSEPYEKVETESLMKMFALACKADREYRALEICQLMRTQHSLQLAIKYASRMRHLQLAQHISELAQKKEEEELAGQGFQDQEAEDDGDDFSAAMQAGYNHTETEWAHNNGHQDDSVTMETQEEEQSRSGPMLVMKEKSTSFTKCLAPSSQGRSNPFKVGIKTSSANSKGTKVFDNMLRPTKTKISLTKSPQESKKKTGKSGHQPKLFQIKKGGKKNASQNDEPANNDAEEEPVEEKKKTVSAFSLWLDENKSDIQEQYPDLEENDLVVKATELFRDIPKPDKKAFAEQAKQINNNKETDNKKRKREDENQTESQTLKQKKTVTDGSPVKKRPLTQSTNSKLAGFAFNKD